MEAKEASKITFTDWARKMSSAFRFIFMKEESKRDFKSKLVSVYGELALERLKDHAAIIERANRSVLPISEKKELEKTVDTILDMKSKESPVLKMKNLVYPFSMAWRVDTMFTRFYSILFYLLVTTIMTILFKFEAGGFCGWFTLLYLLGIYLKGRRYKMKSIEMLKSNNELSNLVYSRIVQKKKLFKITEQSIKEIVEKNYNLIRSNRLTPLFKEALDAYRRNKLALRGTIDKWFYEEFAPQVEIKIDEKPILSDSMESRWKEFLLLVLKLDRTAGSPKLLDEDEEGRQLWLFKRKGVTEEHFKRNKLNIENYLGMYVHETYSGLYTPGDVGILLATFRKKEDEGLLKRILLDMEESVDDNDEEEEIYKEIREIIEETFKNPYDEDWKGLFQLHFPKVQYKTPEFIETGSTWIHVMRMKELNAQSYEKKEPFIESALGEQVYMIHRNYCGKFGVTAIEMAKGSLPDIVTFSEAPTIMDEHKIVLGIDVKGPVTLDYMDRPHIFFVGGTGVGKSTLILNFIRQYYDKEFMMVFADYKDGLEFDFLTNKGYLVSDKPEEFPMLSQRFLNEMKVRANIFKEFGLTDLKDYKELAIRDTSMFQLPRIAFFIEEVATLGQTLKGEERKQAYDNLALLIRLGRVYGIHLIITNQSPDVSALGGGAKGGAIRRNLAFISGKLDANGSEMIFGDDRADSKIPDTENKGLFITKDASSKAVFRAPFMEGTEFRSIALKTWERNRYEDYELGSEKETDKKTDHEENTKKHTTLEW